MTNCYNKTRHLPDITGKDDKTAITTITTTKLDITGKDDKTAITTTTKT